MFVGLFPTSGTLLPKILGVIGSGLCYLEDFPQEREICWAPTVVQHEEMPDGMEEFIWRWSVGIGRYHLLQGWEKVYVNCMPCKWEMVSKVYVRFKASDSRN